MKRRIVFADFNINLIALKQATSMYMYILGNTVYKIMNKIDKADCTRETSITNRVCCNLKEKNCNLAIIIEPLVSDHFSTIVCINNTSDLGLKSDHSLYADDITLFYFENSIGDTLRCSHTLER